MFATIKLDILPFIYACMLIPAMRRHTQWWRFHTHGMVVPSAYCLHGLAGCGLRRVGGQRRGGGGVGSARAGAVARDMQSLDVALNLRRGREGGAGAAGGWGGCIGCVSLGCLRGTSLRGVTSHQGHHHLDDRLALADSAESAPDRSTQRLLNRAGLTPRRVW